MFECLGEEVAAGKLAVLGHLGLEGGHICFLCDEGEGLG